MPLSKKSKGSSAKTATKRDDLKRPFDPRVWKRAIKLVADYRLILEPNREVGYIGSAIEFPTVLAEGRTADECVKSTRQALAVAAATMIESGRRPPAPARRGTRQCQINVRLTSDERFVLDEAARRMGFQGISDFVRTAALERASAA